MRKSVGIFYFSGTGNTEMVAKQIFHQFQKMDTHAELFRIEDILKEDNPFTNITRFDYIGICHPVIAFGTPEIVHRFIRKLPRAKSGKIFLVKTAGGVGIQNYSASYPVIRSLRAKGYDVFYDRIFSIGSNWVVRFDDQVIRSLHSTTMKKIGLMCLEVIAGKRRELNATFPFSLFRTLSTLLNRFFIRFTGKDLYTTKDCNNCTLCIRTCPVENIVQKNGKIKRRLRCICCMRCVYSCPKNAIHFRLFSFFEISGGPGIQNAIDNPDTDTSLGNITKPPFLDRYINDQDF